MGNDSQARKWQITINNPLDTGFTHEVIESILQSFKAIKYYCLADEIGSTHHTHIYVAFENGIRFSTLKNKFNTAHLEMARGTSLQNKDYISKEGKWKNDKKHGTKIPDTFKEWGEIPIEHQGYRSDLENVYDMIKSGSSNVEILEQMPEQFIRLNLIERARQELKEAEFKDVFRNLEVIYIFGHTETGKTRYVMDTHGYSNVHKITDYKNPFDKYQLQDVVLFDEFVGQLSVENMNQYLDGYPLDLPCRYVNKVACFTKVYILSNISLEQQYSNQGIDKNLLNAFRRRIKYIHHFNDDEDGTVTVTIYKNNKNKEKIDTLNIPHPRPEKYLPFDI